MHSPRHNTRSHAIALLVSDAGIAIITVLTIFCIYLFDTITPLGVPVWLLYFIPLALSYWSPRYYAIPAVCGAVTLFLVAGLFLSPEGIPLPHASVFRLAFFLAFICAGIVLWAFRRRQIIEERL